MLTWNSIIFEKEKDLEFYWSSWHWSGIGEKVAMLNIYAPQGENQMEELWNNLLNIISSRHVIWIVFGDFNAVQFKEEHAGTAFSDREVSAFNFFLGSQAYNAQTWDGGLWAYNISYF